MEEKKLKVQILCARVGSLIAILASLVGTVALYSMSHQAARVAWANKRYENVELAYDQIYEPMELLAAHNRTRPSSSPKALESDLRKEAAVAKHQLEVLDKFQQYFDDDLVRRIDRSTGVFELQYMFLCAVQDDFSTMAAKVANAEQAEWISVPLRDANHVLHTIDMIKGPDWLLKVNPDGKRIESFQIKLYGAHIGIRTVSDGTGLTSHYELSVEEMLKQCRHARWEYSEALRSICISQLERLGKELEE